MQLKYIIGIDNSMWWGI